MRTVSRSHRRSFVVVTAIVAGLCATAVATGSTVHADALSDPALTGFSFSLNMPFGQPTPSLSVEGCPGIDNSTQFPALLGDSSFKNQWSPTVSVGNAPSGWAYNGDPVATARLPTQLTLAWGTGPGVGDLSKLQLIEMRLPVSVNGGAPEWLSVGTGSLRRVCPSQLSLEQSPIGEAFPVQWAAGAPAERGCGYVALANTNGAVSAQFTATSVAGYFSDTLPGYVCNNGHAVVQGPSPAPASFVLDPIASKAASAVAGKTVRIVCTRNLEDWDKAFDVPGGTAVVVGGTDAWIEGQCPSIDRASHSKPPARDSAALTVGELAEHMRGIASDNAAVCAAAKTLSTVAAALGVPKSGLKEVTAYGKSLLKSPKLGC